MGIFTKVIIDIGSMSKVDLLIVEDELLLAQDLQTKLVQLGYDIIGTATSGEEALGIVNRKVPDIALLDIDLAGEMSGIEFGSYLKNTYQIPIIYLTQFSDLNTFKRAKMAKPSSYLIKPANIWDIVRAIELSLENHAIAISNVPGEEYFLQKALYLRNRDQRFERVDIQDIQFLKAAGSYTEVCTRLKKFTFSENLSHFERALVIPQLVRVHRSWMINVNNVDMIDESFLYIGEERIPVGKTYKKVVKRYFKTI